MASSSSRASRVALGISILVHALLVAPVGLPWPAGSSAPVAAPALEEPLAFLFVDAPDAPEEMPPEPTPLVATRSARAAQPEAPEPLPVGEAYRAGETSLPTTPRRAGARAAGATADGAAAERQPRPSEPGPDPLSRPVGPVAPGAARRLAAAAGQERLPAPEVDQRLSRASAGSSFRLNTTAWEWAPYIERLKARIEHHISPPAAFYYGTAAWATQVRFRILPDGRLAIVEILDHRGVENLQYVALDAIRTAADYEPLPLNFPEPHLEIVGNFYFNTFPAGSR